MGSRCDFYLAGSLPFLHHRQHSQHLCRQKGEIWTSPPLDNHHCSCNSLLCWHWGGGTCRGKHRRKIFRRWLQLPLHSHCTLPAPRCPCSQDRVVGTPDHLKLLDIRAIYQTKTIPKFFL